MKMLQTGDKCPICGQPIQTTDPNKLILLSARAWWDGQNTNGDGDLCGGGDSGATNADKLRSLPEEKLLDAANRCLGEFGAEYCEDAGGVEVISCSECQKRWARLPYNGWEA